MIDIGSKEEYPSGNLSNFFPHEFMMDDVSCASPEGFLMALKFEDPSSQRSCCALVGKDAKKHARHRNEAWQAQQILWWNGKAYPRESQEYQDLIDRMYEELARQNPEFCDALRATGKELLAHTMGNSDPRKTVLTEKEFVARLMRIRARLLGEQ